MKQIDRIFNAFFLAPKTMLMVAKETGIERASVCRRVSELEDENRIYRVRTSLCKVTNCRAVYYTTNKNFA